MERELDSSMASRERDWESLDEAPDEPWLRRNEAEEEAAIFAVRCQQILINYAEILLSLHIGGYRQKYGRKKSEGDESKRMGRA